MEYRDSKNSLWDVKPQKGKMTKMTNHARSDRKASTSINILNTHPEVNKTRKKQIKMASKGDG